MSSTMCPFPWINLNSNTDGRIKLCCSIVDNIHLKNEAGVELNFGTHGIEEIWNSVTMRDVREKMSRGERPAECSVCWHLEDRNVYSSRQAALKDYGPWMKNLNSLGPISLELRLGHLCNLRCNSCWSLSSQSVFLEREKLLSSPDLPESLRQEWQWEVDMVKQTPLDWYKKPLFLETFKKLAPTLRRLYLTGGEPTLIPENVQFIKTLLDCGNTDCEISFTTNLTHWNEELYQALVQFKRAEVQVSIDGFAELNEYLRFPTQWKTVEKNFLRLIQLPAAIKIKVFSVLQAANAQDLYQVPEWLHSLNLKRPLIYAPIPLEAPTYLSTHLLSPEQRQRAITNLKSLLEKDIDQHQYQVWMSGGIKQAIDHLSNPGEQPGEDLRKKMYLFSKVIKNNRKISHHRVDEIFSEWGF